MSTSANITQEIYDYMRHLTNTLKTLSPKNEGAAKRHDLAEAFYKSAALNNNLPNYVDFNKP